MNRLLTLAVLVLTIAPGVSLAQPPGAAPPPVAPEQRPVLAVMPFEDGAVHTHFSWYYGGRRWRPGVGIADMLATELFELSERNGTFRVVERERLYEVLAEQDLGVGGRLDPRTAAEIGRILGADILVMGSVTRFDVQEDTIYLPHEFGFGTQRCRANVALDGRLVDTDTAELLGAHRGEGSASRYGVSIYRGPLAGFDMSSPRFQQSALGKASQEAVAQFAEGLAAQLGRLTQCLPFTPLEGLVAYVEDPLVMINLGARDGVRVGDVFLIRRERHRVHDPATGELLTVLYTDIGRLTVLDVQEQFATGTVVLLDEAPGPPRVEDVVVPLPEGRNDAPSREA